MTPGLLSRLVAEIVTVDGTPRVLSLDTAATDVTGPRAATAATRLDLPWEQDAVASLDELVSTAASVQANGSIVVAVPWVRVKDVTTAPLAVEGLPRRAELHEVVTALVVKQAPAGTVVTVVAPPSFGAAPLKTSLAEIRQYATPALVIDGGRRLATAMNVHPSFHPLLVQMRVGAKAKDPALLTRFAELDRMAGEDDDAVLTELRRLLRAKGGSGRLGWVLREEIDRQAPLRPSFHALERRERHRQLRRVGDLVPLERLVALVPSVRRDLPGEGPKGEVRLMEGRAISRDASVDVAHYRLVTGPAPTSSALQPGDLCFRSITSPSDARPVVCAQFPPDYGPPVYPAQSVTALRFREAVDDVTREVVTAYLVSPHADALLRGALDGPRLSARHLLALDVPLPDATLRGTIEALQQDEQRLERWTADLRAARRRLLQDDNIVRSLLEVEDTGRLARQRVAAAERMDELGGRVQAFMPYPLALMWRGVATSRPDDAGYLHVLQCAEGVSCYLSCMAVLFASAAGVRELGPVKSLRDSFGRGGQGVTMGDWTAIAAAAATCKTPTPVDERTPFVEIREAMAGGGEIIDALASLTKRRNDHAHGRGPRGATVVAEAFDDATSDLTRLYRELEWLMRYPLRLVESTTWDSIRETCTVGFRELVGDHHLVPLQEEQRASPTIDARRLHCVDQFGELHLIDPMLTLRVCDQCHVPSVFALSTWDRGEDISTLRALDHNHVVADAEVSDRLRRYGFIPTAAKR